MTAIIILLSSTHDYIYIYNQYDNKTILIKLQFSFIDYLKNLLKIIIEPLSNINKNMCNVIPISRSYFKILEILYTFNLLLVDLEPLYLGLIDLISV